MKKIQNEKGIALVMVLILSAVALAVMAGLIYMVTGRTQLSGGGKRYATALDCAKGGIDIVTEIITKGKETGTPDRTAIINSFSTAGINFNMPIAQPCLTNKLSGAWTPTTGCDNNVSIMDKDHADFFFDLGNNPTCRVYGKIVLSRPGNTAYGGGLEKGGTATAVKAGAGGGGAGGGDISVMPIPSNYTVEIESVMIDTATENSLTGERAKLSVLYAY